jgi:hypothetical protein
MKDKLDLIVYYPFRAAQCLYAIVTSYVDGFIKGFRGER